MRGVYTVRACRQAPSKGVRLLTISAPFTSPDVKCIVHLHTPATVAVSCLKQGFKCLAQESAYFHKKVAYHTWEGISDDTSGANAFMARERGSASERVRHI